MTRHPVNSTNIRAIGYDPLSKILEVEFVGSGVYRYRDVPVGEHILLVTSKSIGKTFCANIKGKFEFERVGADAGAQS